MESNVEFPEPLGPTIAYNTPASNMPLASETAGFNAFLYRYVTFLSVIVGMI